MKFTLPSRKDLKSVEFGLNPFNTFCDKTQNYARMSYLPSLVTCLLHHTG